MISQATELTYDANGDPVYGDQKMPLMTKCICIKNQIMPHSCSDSDDSKADRKLYDQLRDQLQDIQLMPQTLHI